MKNEGILSWDLLTADFLTQLFGRKSEIVFSDFDPDLSRYNVAKFELRFGITVVDIPVFFIPGGVFGGGHTDFVCNSAAHITVGAFVRLHGARVDAFGFRQLVGDIQRVHARPGGF